MSMIVKRRKRSASPDVEPATAKPRLRPGAGLDDGQIPAVYRQTLAGRRITFLEAVAWAVVQAERGGEEFRRELIEAREAEWGDRPWNGATSEDRFLGHVEDIARAFTTNPVRYPNRLRQPNPAVRD